MLRAVALGLLLVVVSGLHPRHFILNHGRQSLVQTSMGDIGSLVEAWKTTKQRLLDWETLLPDQNSAFENLAFGFGFELRFKLMAKEEELKEIEELYKEEDEAEKKKKAIEKVEKDFEKWWTQTFPFGYGGVGDHYFNAALYGKRGSSLTDALGAQNPYDIWLRTFRANAEASTFRAPVLGLPDYHEKQAKKCTVCLENGGIYVFDSDNWDDWECWKKGDEEYNEDKAVEIMHELRCYAQWPFARDVNSIVMGDVNKFLIDFIALIQSDWDKQTTRNLLIEVMTFQLERSIDQTAKYRFGERLREFFIAKQHLQAAERAIPLINQKVETELSTKENIEAGADFILNAKGIN